MRAVLTITLTCLAAPGFAFAQAPATIAAPPVQPTPVAAAPMTPSPVTPSPMQPAAPVTPAPTAEAASQTGDGRAAPPEAPTLAPCPQTRVDAAVTAEMETRPPSTGRAVGGAVAGTAGAVAGGAVAGPVGAAVAGSVMGTVGRVVTSAVTGESAEREREERRARDTLRWCTADGRMLSLDPVGNARPSAD